MSIVTPPPVSQLADRADPVDAIDVAGNDSVTTLRAPRVNASGIATIASRISPVRGSVCVGPIA